MRVPLAGGTQETLLSEVGPVLLPFFTTRDACALRLVCREFLAAATEHPWQDKRTAIQGSIAAWRACFPRARCANVGYEPILPGTEFRVARVYDADFVHFEGLRGLNMRGCGEVTDAAFARLRGIHTLDMSGCDQVGITDTAFAHLRGIHTLDMSGCSRVTDAAFAHLEGVQTLFMDGCTGVTDAGFQHLRGIRTLYMPYLTGITAAALEYLDGAASVNMTGCLPGLIQAARARGLPVRFSENEEEEEEEEVEGEEEEEEEGEEEGGE